MATTTQRETTADTRTGNRASPATSTPSPARIPVENSGGVLRLACALCAESFLLDPEEYWRTSAEEMELLGRQFFSVRGDAPLCPRCLHAVEQTGAERIYWRLAHC